MYVDNKNKGIPGSIYGYEASMWPTRITYRSMGTRSTGNSQESMHPSVKKLEDSINKAAPEYHAIPFLYLADRQCYGKIIKEMENVMLRKRKPFSKECKWCMPTNKLLQQLQGTVCSNLGKWWCWKRAIRRMRWTVLDERRPVTVQANAKRNCHPRQTRKYRVFCWV